MLLWISVDLDCYYWGSNSDLVSRNFNNIEIIWGRFLALKDGTWDSLSSEMARMLTKTDFATTINDAVDLMVECNIFIIKVHEAEAKLNKRGKGRPWKNPPQDLGLGNEFLPDSDFQNCKKVLLKEVHQTLNIGKLIGTTMIAVE
ncbi:hypothetical protein V6N11_010489 [Hibiscus sabdariffa]|uniref:Uncharacterized protein n=1 Tax=Hibiscus sabdariffa TaxID=183260 RepID=A0ABR2S5W8_9ROSI